MLAVVGATGRTGSLIAEEAARRGIQVLLVGRNAEALKALSGRTGGLPWAAVDLATGGLAAVLEPATAVLNAAGPFEHTAQAVLDAAISSGTHYLDVSNDLGPVLRVLRSDERLRAAGVGATPAVGFGTVATDGLARLLADAVPDGVRIELGMAIGASGGSRGAAESTRAVVEAGGRRLQDGVLQRAPLGRGTFRAPGGGPTLVPVGLADLAITPLTTGVRTVVIGVAMPLPAAAAALLLPVVAAGARLLPALPARPARERSGATPVSRAWARLLRADGSGRAAALTAGEGFRFSADSAVAAAERVLGGDVEPGAGTASGRWGSAFLAAIPGVVIETMDA